MSASGKSLACVVVDDELMAREILKSLIENTPGLHVLGEAQDAFKALKILQNEAVDILFLDVEMPGMSGIDLAKGLVDKPEIILTTSHANYALEAFEIDVLDFLLKPIQPGRFLKAISKINQLDLAKKDDIIFLKEDSALIKVDLKEVEYVEAFGDYIKVYMNGSRKVFRTTMKSVESRLTRNFVRIHRSFIVNINFVAKIEDSMVVLKTESIPVGKTYRTALLDKFS